MILTVLKKIGSKYEHGSPYLLDAFCIFLILLLNPAIYSLGKSLRVYSPDTVAYLTMARDLFDKGLLYLPSWGGADSHLICPPLYPFLVACGQVIFGESIKVAEWVSSISLMGASLFFFFYMKHTTNRLVALATVVAIQTNYYYLYFAMAPLTEGVFLLILAISFYCLIVSIDLQQSRFSHLQFLAIGFFSALAFLARQVGLFVGPFMALILFGKAWMNKKKSWAFHIGSITYVGIGWLIVVIPYATALYWQTGQLPLKQKFTQSKQTSIKLDLETRKYIDRIARIPNENYAIIYAKRRLFRKLLPDCSRMISEVLQDGPNRKKFAILASVKKPRIIADNMRKNTHHLRRAISSYSFTLFLALCFTPLIVPSRTKSKLEALHLPLFLFAYFFIISLFTAEVPRYSLIMFPFFFLHLISELFRLFKRIQGTMSNVSVYCTVAISFAYTVVIFSTPQFFTSVKLYPKVNENTRSLDCFKKYIQGAPVFSLTPLLAYLSGGYYRILPNDSLQRIITYAHKTGVNWLLLSKGRSSLSEAKLYVYAKWLENPSLAEKCHGGLRLVCSTKDNALMLYEILEIAYFYKEPFSSKMDNKCKQMIPDQYS